MALGPLSARQRAMRYLTGLLRYDEPQTLTEPQREQARANIGAADAAVAVVPPARTISAGTGLTGGGNLTQNRTISADLATEAEAQGGAGNDKLMTPIRTRQAIDAVTIGRGQTWVDVTASRGAGNVYQNTTGSPIMVAICSANGIEEVSPNGSTGWVRVGEPVTDSRKFQSFIVPPQHHYRCRGATSIERWSELR